MQFHPPYESSLRRYSADLTCKSQCMGIEVESVNIHGFSLGLGFIASDSIDDNATSPPSPYHKNSQSQDIAVLQ